METDRRTLTRLCPVFACVIQIDVHLAHVGGYELSDLEVDHDEAAQPAMEEQEIDPIPRIPRFAGGVGGQRR